MREVIGRIIRNTRLQDSSFIESMHDWIFEAVSMMKTKQTLQGDWEEVNVVFHKGQWPCGLVYVDAVEYNGNRLVHGGSVRPAEKETAYLNPANGDIFFSEVNKVPTTENHSIYVTKMTEARSLPAGKDYYTTDTPGYITTSFADGKVTVYFRRYPVDKDGIPMIPDNENFKQAIYWYVRAMMIGAGYPDKAFSYEQCFEKFEKLYAPRAVAEIRYPTPDEMEHRVNTFVRFMPPQNYYDNFFRNDFGEGIYDTKVW